MSDERKDWTQGVPELLVSRCVGCSQRWYFRRETCPRCGSADISKTPAGGGGVVVACTTVHRNAAGKPPFGVALVHLDEGVRVMGRCVAGTRVGRRVTAYFLSDLTDPAGPTFLPCFREVAS